MELRFKSEAFHNGKNKPDNMTWQIYLNPKLSRKLCANLEPELSQSNLEISKTGSLKSSSTTQIFDSKVHVQQKVLSVIHLCMFSFHLCISIGFDLLSLLHEIIMGISLSLNLSIFVKKNLYSFFTYILSYHLKFQQNVI
ncbi:hypothetical protein RND81_02G102900 [Saponaria officinalis]|uniref:Uncharacterized protein n=1 Tax=Saponaria officinalis TaxID=3572 RepID=A0AAW1MKQ9_SAPOF